MKGRGQRGKRCQFTATFKSQVVLQRLSCSPDSHQPSHSALGYLTPAEYEADWLVRQPEPVLE